MSFILCGVFFLSGIAALLFETLWCYQAGLALGNSVWASSLVLAGFMGGLAIGNGLVSRIGSRVSRPLRLYVFLEVAIGLTGLAVVLWLPRLTPLLSPVFRPVLDHLGILNALRLGIAFFFLLLPSAAMGATLPLLVQVLSQQESNFGQILGRLYGWNTLGAVIGALIGETVLFKWCGIQWSAVIAALLNTMAALVAATCVQPLDRFVRVREANVPVRVPPRAKSLLVAAGIFGGILLAFEVVWARFLALFMLGTSLAFAIMLSVVLAGISLGGLVAARGISQHREAHRWLPTIAFANGVVCVGVYRAIDLVIRSFHGLAVARWYEVLALAFPLIFPVTLLSGALFTLLGEALHREISDSIRSAGLLTLANTIGAMLGSLLAALLLLPTLGIERSMQLLAGGYGAGGLFLMLGGLRPAVRWERIPLTISIGLLAAAYLLFPSGLMTRRYLLYPIQRYASSYQELPVGIREGLTETIVYLRREWFGEPLYYRLVTNSYSMSGTMLSGQRYMKLFVYLPAALHVPLKHALLISYGVGMTAKALTNTSTLETIDIVDISKDILEMNTLVYPNPIEHPLNDPRVRVHVEDGRFFLQTTDRHFDLITGEPPPPKMAGIISLYTREYFELIAQHLTDGGMVTYWLPVHSLLSQDGDAIIQAFCGAFPDCSLWGGDNLDWILMGTRHAQGPVSEEQFARQWQDPVTGPELRALGVETPEQLGALFIADAKDLKALTHGALPVSDNYPKRLSSQFPHREDSQAFYRPWMDVRVTKERFLGSSFIAQLWPASIRLASVPYFDFQGSINRCEFGDLGGRVEALPILHQVLTGSSLRTLALWLLDSDAARARIAAAAVASGRRDPELNYQLGVSALADRRYTAAQALFASVSPPTPFSDFLRIYALCMAGQAEDARRVLGAVEPRLAHSENGQRFFRFISNVFHLNPVTQ